MEDKKKKGKKIVGIIGILSVLIAGAIVLDIFGSWQLKLANGMYKSSTVSNDIVIVGIDDASINAKKRGIEIRDRAVMAKIIETIARANPKVVGLDYVFEGYTQGMSSTAIADLARKAVKDTLSREGIANEIMPYVTVPTPPDKALQKALQSVPRIVMATVLGRDSIVEGTSMLVSDPISSETLFMGANAVRGIVNVKTDKDDGVVRKIFTDFTLPSGGKVYSLPLQVAMLAGKGEGVVPRVDDENRMYIRYFGEPNSYKTISAIDVYDGKVSDEQMRDKIVLFGVKSLVFNDVEHTPIDPDSQMAGVEILANAVQTIMDEKFLRDEPLVLKIVFAVGVLAMMFSLFVMTTMRNAIVGAVAIALLYAWLSIKFFGMGWVADYIYLYVALIAGSASGLMYRHVEEKRAREFLTKALGTYVNPVIEKRIRENPSMLNLGGVQANATMLFLDIRGFTTISESLSPSELVQLLNGFFETVSEGIFSFEGMVDKYEGDAVMGVFGVPIDDEAHAVKACASSLDIIKRARAYEPLARLTDSSPIRIGINSGPVIAGNVGSSKRLNYTVIGDAVNLASRLEGVNKLYGTSILVGETTYESAKDHFVFRPVDKIRVKGKAMSITVYELRGLKTENLPSFELYAQAYAYYVQKEFAQAKEVFMRHLIEFPTDTVAKVHVERCDAYMQNPPPAEWDGVYTMKTK